MSTHDSTATNDSPSVMFDAAYLVPVVIQEVDTQAVLMIGFMNRDALAATQETGRVHFWSRSRNRLWRKGETSGHEQIVDEIRINCEQNSLLVRVRQTGAVCHDGYRSCYYRRLEPDGSLSIVMERSFDPASVYGSSQTEGIGPATKVLFDAYAYLRDNDLADVSGTSARLRAEDDTTGIRLGDELEELAGVLDGSHVHSTFEADVLLESTQVLYWTILVALRANVSWDRLRPDRALQTAADGMTPDLIAKLVRAEADSWRVAPAPGSQPAARAHAVLALVGQTCQIAGRAPIDPVTADLRELCTRTYLAPYFASVPR